MGQTNACMTKDGAKKRQLKLQNRMSGTLQDDNYLGAIEVYKKTKKLPNVSYKDHKEAADAFEQLENYVEMIQCCEEAKRLLPLSDKTEAEQIEITAELDLRI